MIISKRKLEDIRMRDLILQIMETLLRMGNIQEAKEFGVHAKRYREKIETHDYTLEDQEEARLLEYDRKWNELNI